MKKFKFDVVASYRGDMEVEAKNRSEAIKEARDMALDGWLINNGNIEDVEVMD